MHTIGLELNANETLEDPLQLHKTKGLIEKLNASETQVECNNKVNKVNKLIRL